MRRAVLLFAVLATACGGCGGSHAHSATTARVAAAPALSESTSQTISASCRTIGRTRTFAVLCPSRLPAEPWHVRPALGLRDGPCTYLISIETRTRTTPFHIIFGGQCAALSLAVRAGHWGEPFKHEHLGLIGGSLKPGQRHVRRIYPRVLRAVHVHGHAGLLLQVAPFPDGGVHGGHVAAVWDQGGHGYTLSVHFSEQPAAPTVTQEQAVLAAASSMSAAAGSR